MKPTHKAFFYYDSNGNRNYKGGEKITLAIPGSGRIDSLILNSKFEDFIEMIKRAPQERLTLQVCNEVEQIDIEISYDPVQRGLSGGYPTYKLIPHITENTLYQTLLTKAGQLRESGYNGPLGIIVCDGGFSPFHNKSLGIIDCSADEVVAHFLQEYPQISFVLIIAVELDSFKRGERKNIKINLYRGKAFRLLDQGTYEAFEQLPFLLPTPECDAFNAIKHLRATSQPRGRLVKDTSISTMSDSKNGIQVRISARTLLELLAGKLTPDRFDQISGFAESDPELPPRPHRRPFKRQLELGNVITDIGFEKSADERDDDFVVITLRGPDPSISKFSVPKLNDKMR